MVLDFSAVYAGNTLHAYAVALGVALMALVAFAILQKIVLTRLAKLAERSSTKADDAMVAMARSVKPPFYWTLAAYLGIKLLALPPMVSTVVNGVMLAWILYFAVRASGAALEMLLLRASSNDGERAARKTLAGVGKGALWVIAGLLLLSNLGINVTSLIAGLGIGGVAVAFALQNILADLFSSFAIYFDKPFEIGDFIIVGDSMGTVEKIGIKTTRLRALQGEEIAISNRDLTSARIQNFKKMRERRIVMHFGIIYETPRQIVAALSEKIRAVVEPIEGVRVDRIHFASFGDSSLDFEMVYYVASGDYTEYMDRQQEINLALLELFSTEGVAFAYPTRTVYLPKS